MNLGILLGIWAFLWGFGQYVGELGVSVCNWAFKCDVGNNDVNLGI